ncbi:MAG: hypothetical protein IJQ75_08115 [Synergistaceae bacterium]|nr:hypothetical protein [Synergistaceae bacterium]
MNKRDIKFKIEEIIRQLFRDKGISENLGLTECVSGIIESLREEKILGNPDEEGRTRSLLNSVLSRFNLKIVSADETPCEFAFDVDEETMKEAVNNLADNLVTEGGNSREESEALREEVRTLHSELECARDEAHKAKLELDSLRVLIAGNIKEIISFAEKKKPITESVNTMLDELEMKAVWSPEEEGMTEAAMFTVLKCADPEARRGKPCITFKGRVIARGLKFIADEGSC